MVQAARSGTQNIVEGSAASGTSKRTEMKLTDTARFSLEELRRDYRDYLRQRGLKEWSYREPLRRFRGRSTRSSRSPTFNRDLSADEPPKARILELLVLLLTERMYRMRSQRR